MGLKIYLTLLVSSLIFLETSLVTDGQTVPKVYAGIILSIIGLIIYLSRQILSDRTHKLDFQQNDYAVIILILYINLLAVFKEVWSLNLLIYCILSFCIFLIAKKRMDKILSPIILIVTVISSIESLIGISRYIVRGFNDDIWKLNCSGNFDNPAGFAISILFGTLLWFSLRINKIYKCLLLTILTTGIILSGSRAGWLCYLLIICCYFSTQLIDAIKRYGKIQRSLLLTGCVALCCVLYMIKIDSAKGRVLIWECSCEMINDQPWFGYGPSGFAANYMEYQAKFFEENPDSNYFLLAGEVMHPFNELINLIIFMGIFGFLIIIIGIIIPAFKVFLMHPSPENKLGSTILLTTIIFGCFSYPLQYPLVWLMLIFALAILFRNTNNVLTINKGTRIGFGLSICFFLLGGIHFTKQFIAETKLKKAADYALLKNDRKVIDSYLRLGKQLENSPYYHYSFAAALNKMSHYRESIDQLDKCKLRLSNYTIQMLYANNFLKLNEFEKAETHLLKASAMCPKKFMPSYLLVYAYDSMKLYDRARYFAISLVSKTVKIPSSTVEKIIDDIKLYLANGYFAEDSLIEKLQINQ